MTIKKDALTIRPTDIAFKDSPDAGHPDCKCSRCGAQIQYMEFPIRFFTTNDNGTVDQNTKEYRLCELCTTGVKFFYCRANFEGVHQCRKQCEDCKNEKIFF